MHRTWMAGLVLAALATGAGASQSRQINETFPVERGQTVRIDFPVGELRIEAGAGRDVRADLTFRCRWLPSDCDEALKEIAIEARPSRRRLHLEVTGLHGWSRSTLEIEGTITVPASASLEVDMGVGELEIQGIKQDLSVDLGVGEVDAWLPRSAVESVALDAGVGSASLRGAGEYVEGRRSLLVGSEVYWDDGKGEARVRIDVGVGEISLRLEE